LGTNPLLIQQIGHPHGKGRHAGLGVPSLGQLLLRALKAQLFQVEIHRGVVKKFSKLGELLVEVLPHTHMLAALSGVHKG
jgi:hypothetical protein